jgi:hypothetical protein
VAEVLLELVQVLGLLLLEEVVQAVFFKDSCQLF